MSEIEGRPFYDGRMVYVADVAKIEAGDILLTRNVTGGGKKGLAQAKIIRAASGGEFDHVLICAVPPTFIEATGVGVKTLTLQMCFAHELANVRVLRYPEKRVAEKAAQFAQLQVGRDYSTKKAMASVFPRALVDEIADRGIFCSALVAHAFVEAGGDLFMASSVGKTTPATIQKMSGLNDVTELVFRSVLAPPNLERMVPLDAERPPSPSVAQTEITGRYAKELVPLAESIIASFSEAELSTPNTFYDCLTFLMAAVDATTKVSPERQEAYFEAVSHLDAQAAALLETGELRRVFETLATMDASDISNSITDSFKPHPNIDVVGMCAQRQTTKMQIESRSNAVRQFAPYRINLAAMRAWIDLQEFSIEPFQQRLAAISEILQRIGAPGGA